MNKPKSRTVFAAVVAAGLGMTIPLVVPAPADAFWSRHNLEPFNPDANPPRPYDRNSVGYGGTGRMSGGPHDCYWSREQTFVGGRLVWRPLFMCMYPD